MTANPPVPYDLLGFAAFIAAFTFSPEVSTFLAPYMVIVIAGSIGGALRLSFRPRTSRISAIAYFIRIVGVVVVLTGSVAWGVEEWVSSALAPRQTLAPIALLLGVAGDDPRFWGPLFTGLFRRMLAVVDTIRHGGSKSDGSDA